nr:hypothetical protein [Wolbachia endosymbiont of Drosophila nikananu]
MIKFRSLFKVHCILAECIVFFIIIFYICKSGSCFCRAFAVCDVFLMMRLSAAAQLGKSQPGILRSAFSDFIAAPTLAQLTPPLNFLSFPFSLLHTFHHELQSHGHCP